jgi:hypothetical protein
MSTRTPPILIHATPPLDPLPASDIKSIYLAGLLQLANPGRWGITTADWGDHGGRSPCSGYTKMNRLTLSSGHIPYLTHLDHLIRQDHLSSLPGFEHPDSTLSTEQKADSLIWEAYIEGQLTDLVVCLYIFQLILSEADDSLLSLCRTIRCTLYLLIIQLQSVNPISQDYHSPKSYIYQYV